MKLKETMNQTVTKVNVFGPEMSHMAEADVTLTYGRQYYFHRERQGGNSSVGVLIDGMVQDGLAVNLGDLYSSEIDQYAETSRKERGLANDHTEVGLDDSTRNEIRTCTGGSVQQIDDCFNTCIQLIHRGYENEYGS